MADYGYFGKGAEGYAHYKQTFDSTMHGSRSGSGSKKGIRTFTIIYSWATQRQSEQNNRYIERPRV